ncbi:MAG: glycoside hydrolase family 108 protein [Polymorphobacter sp.]
MADFARAFERTLMAEGGYQLTNVSGDRGGQTYAGIARNPNPQWPGWAFIDRGEIPPTQMVRDFYRDGWWTPIRGDEIADQRVAESIFDFGVNTSAYGRPAVAVKLAQIVAGVTPDGDFGPKTLQAVNAMDGALFAARYTVAKIARYRDIVARDRTQIKFLLGWISRALKGAA